MKAPDVQRFFAAAIFGIIGGALTAVFGGPVWAVFAVTYIVSNVVTGPPR